MRERVLEATRNGQEPATYARLGGDEILIGRLVAAPTQAARTSFSDPASIAEAQRLLNDLGFAVGAADGVAGRRTVDGLRRFQLRYGLPVTGVIGADTLVALRVALAAGQGPGAPVAVSEEGVQVAVGTFEAERPGGRDDLSVFRECPSCPELVVVPGGSFTMGSPEGEAGWDDDEGPQHRVRIEQFALGRTEVTFAQWDACVSDGGCVSNRRPDDEGWGRGSRLVINVSWQDAREYIGWLNGKVSGSPYRLPSESEWEYAARAGTTTPFSFGATISTDLANYNGNLVYGSGRKGPFRGKTVPVGEVDASNAWGLRHMHGNVWEWTEDCWHNSYVGAPMDGSAWLSSQDGNCSRRVVRGGSWIVKPQALRSASRLRNEPDNRDVNLGFRPARTLFTP